MNKMFLRHSFQLTFKIDQFSSQKLNVKQLNSSEHSKPVMLLLPVSVNAVGLFLRWKCDDLNSAAHSEQRTPALFKGSTLLLCAAYLYLHVL